MEIGSKWNGWTIEKRLGAGSFGTVYKVTKDEFSHHYESALKVISIPQNESELAAVKSEGMDDKSVTVYFRDMVEDITEELALMSRLKGNTNIVSYEDHIVTMKENSFGWDIYVRMELLTPLNDYIVKNSMTIREVIQLGIDICQALEVCQKYNIIHRDIKPENIFVSDLGKFKLGDFGIARQLEKTVAAMSKKGTYTYMAPEIYKCLPYNSTVDIYSLGIVLYRFLNNNRTPFLPKDIKYSDRDRANIIRFSGAEIPKPCNAEGRLAEIVLKACAYKPEDRYESAVELKQALHAILYNENEAVLIYPSGDELPQDIANVEVTDNTDAATPEEDNEAPEGTLYMFRSDAEKADEEERKAQEEIDKKSRQESDEKEHREFEKQEELLLEEKPCQNEELDVRENEEIDRRIATEESSRDIGLSGKIIDLWNADESDLDEDSDDFKSKELETDSLRQENDIKKIKNKRLFVAVAIMIVIVIGVVISTGRLSMASEVKSKKGNESSVAIINGVQDKIFTVSDYDSALELQNHSGEDIIIENGEIWYDDEIKHYTIDFVEDKYTSVSYLVEFDGDISEYEGHSVAGKAKVEGYGQDYNSLKIIITKITHSEITIHS